MYNIKQKSKIFTIALILVLTFSTIIVALPLATAHDPAWAIPTHAKLGFSSNPIGVGQTTLIYAFLGNTPYPSAALENDYRFHNYNITIVSPDGSSFTQIFETVADSTGVQFDSFTPTQIGTYTIYFNYPGQAINDYSHDPNSPFVGDSYLPSSTVKTLTVTEEQLPDPITTYPLPTEYWTRPIYGENNIWWQISSNWLGSGAPGYGGLPGPNHRIFSGDSVGPKTGHVMWTKPLQFGGVVGGNNFIIQGNTWFEGSAYNQRFENPIIVQGRLIYTEPLSFTGVPGFFGSGVTGPVKCVDLRTGEVIWSRTDIPTPSFAYIYDLEDPQQHGVYPAILFTSNFGRAFDAETGDALFNVTGVPSGTTVIGPQGEHLRYRIANAGNSSNPDYRLLQWNSTNLWGGRGFPTGGLGLSPSISGTVDASIPERYDWNISIPWRNTMSSNPSTLQAFYNDIIIMRNGSLPSTNADPSIQNPYTYFGVNLDPSRGPIGSVLWWHTVTPPFGIQIISYGGADPTARVFVESYRQTSTWIGYSMITGEKIWGPTESQEDFDYFGSQGPGTLANVIAYGKLYSCAYSGILYTYDLATGNILWTYGNGGEGNSTFGGLGVYYNRYPTFISAIGDGVIYLVTSEHTVETPIYKGAVTRAVDAETGEELYTLSAYTGEFAANSFAIADGYATLFNGYDNQIYSIGKGPSAITVKGPGQAVQLGNPALITGTVMDISAGTKQNEQAARFPDGVPAVSDVSMKDWMGYVYQQKPRPQDAVGVEVRIQILDPNSEYAWIGTATSDSYGNYAYSFIPQMQGMYAIIATFIGSSGYWGSETTTYLTVGPAQQMPAGYPGYEGPSAQDVANNVIANLPANPTPSQISQAVISNLPPYPEQKEVTIPAYTTIDIVLIILVAIAIIIGLVSIIMLRKK